MAKASSQFVCQQCGYSQVGWAGKCPNCGTWGSLVETRLGTERKGTKASKGEVVEARKLSEVPQGATTRTKTNISELDRVLGGGLVSGQVVLLAGEPGIGKSTVLLQVAQELPNVLYVSGEESGSQVKIRADRLGIKVDQVLFIESTNIDAIIEALEEENKKNPLSLVIIDSIQTMSTSDLSGLPGSVGQVRECAFRLLRFAKSTSVPVIIVGHVTKEGTVAGPAVLAHIVDSVLWFEGDKTLTLRILRSMKNRFGATDEVGIFQMRDQGLIPMEDLTNLFLAELGAKSVPGSVVTSIMEGTRPILVEIQSLVVPTKLPIPRRVAQGIDNRRLELILAVLTRRCGLSLWEQDVFVNVAGGITIREPGADLAVALSVASALLDKPLPSGIIALGEVGLLGEVRQVEREEKRITQAKRQGYKRVIRAKEFPYLKSALQKLF